MKTLSLLMLAMLLCGTAYAGGNSVSLSVTCTIPAIPGVNVPYAESTSVRGTQAGQATAQAQTLTQEKTGARGTLLVKTFYPR